MVHVQEDRNANMHKTGIKFVQTWLNVKCLSVFLCIQEILTIRKKV